jgi:hypothetical protein
MWFAGQLTAVLLSAVAAGGATFYVAPGGSDGADGSVEHPWATIQHAAESVRAGDTVHVAPGQYSRAVVTMASGTEAARIRFVSDTPWGARITTAGSDCSWTNRGDYVDIEGFDISGDGRLGILNLASSVRIMGNHVHDIPALNSGGNGGAGIDNGDYAARDSDIVGNTVHDIGDTGSPGSRVHGIYLANYGGHVWNNISYRNEGWGIHAWHAARHAVIANNLVFANGRGGIVIGAGDSPGGVDADGFIVANNIAVHNGGYGVVECGRIGKNNRYLNNLAYRNALGAFSLQHGNLAQGTVEADPMLVGYQADGTGDYHLAPGSPAIRAGTALGAPAEDLDGAPRSPAAGIDIGPYGFRPGQ